MKKSEWISIKERLPEAESNMVLVCLSDKRIFIGFIYNDNEWQISYSDGMKKIYEYSHVTHWMPLPTPPKQ